MRGSGWLRRLIGSLLVLSACAFPAQSPQSIGPSPGAARSPAARSRSAPTHTPASTSRSHGGSSSTDDTPQPQLPSPFPTPEACPPWTVYHGTFCTWRKPTRKYYLLCRPLSGGKVLLKVKATRVHGNCPTDTVCQPHGEPSKRNWHPGRGLPPQVDCLASKDVHGERRRVKKLRLDDKLKLKMQPPAATARALTEVDVAVPRGEQGQLPTPAAKEDEDSSPGSTAETTAAHAGRYQELDEWAWLDSMNGVDPMQLSSSSNDTSHELEVSPVATQFLFQPIGVGAGAGAGAGAGMDEDVGQDSGASSSSYEHEHELEDVDRWADMPYFEPSCAQQ